MRPAWGDLAQVKRRFDAEGRPALGDLAFQTPATSRRRPWDEVGAQPFVDAYVPRDGDRMFDLAASASRVSLDDALKSGATTRPAPAAATFNVNQRDRAWVDGKMTPQPVAVAMQPIRLTGAVDRVARKAYVRATGYPNKTFDAAFEAAKRRSGWRTLAVESGHDMMVDAPEHLADFLQSL